MAADPSGRLLTFISQSDNISVSNFERNQKLESYRHSTFTNILRTFLDNLGRRVMGAIC